MRFSLLISAICLAGCTVAANPFVVDGSRADGKVYVTSGVTTQAASDIDWTPVTARALERCVGWGYTSIDAFEGVRSRVVDRDPLTGQRTWEHERIYQCITDTLD